MLELYKHRTLLDTWFKQEAGQHFIKYIESWTQIYLNELNNNYLTKDGRDTSDIIRGRLRQLQEIYKLPDEMKDLEKMKAELFQLENEGYTSEHDPKNMQSITGEAGLTQ
jgi:hypothetical protein